MVCFSFVEKSGRNIWHLKPIEADHLVFLKRGKILEGTVCSLPGDCTVQTKQLKLTHAQGGAVD